MSGPEKHGPKGTLAQLLEERAREGGVGIDVDVSVERVEGAVTDGVGRARDGIKAGLQKVRTLEEAIAEKLKEEERSSGCSMLDRVDRSCIVFFSLFYCTFHRLGITTHSITLVGSIKVVRDACVANHFSPYPL